MTAAKTMNITTAQSELSALKAELQEKQLVVSLLQDETAYHQSSLATLRAQRDKLELAVGMADESVKGTTAALRRNAGRPNEKFCKDALAVAASASRDATTLLEAFDNAGAIKVADSLVKGSQDKLRAAASDLSRMSHKADDLSKRFQSAYAEHGQSLYEQAIERLSKPGAYLRARADVAAIERTCRRRSRDRQGVAR